VFTRRADGEFRWSASWTPTSSANHLAVIFQDFQHYAPPGRDNIGLGRHQRLDDLDAITTAARVGLQQLNSRFAAYRAALGLPGGLDFHSLRRSYVTHLVEDGWDARFVQEQAGHEHASTTSIYTCVSADFRTRTLRRVLDQTVQAALARRAP
jgi:site-specific recombinase XerD